MPRYECRTAQKGFAAGKAFVIRPDRTGEYRQGNPTEESDRLETAAAEMNRRLEAGKEHADPAESAVIDAEILILNGEEFLGSARRGIREERLGAPEAVKQAAEKLCEMLMESGQDYVRQRGEDVRGLAAGLTALITGGLETPAEMIRGILTETGSATSHVSVLAGNYGIPYLYGLENLPEKVHHQDYLILDPEGASVWVNPPAEKIREAEARQEKIREAREEQRKRAAGKTTRTRICANISRAEEADGLPEKGADGIGL